MKNAQGVTLIKALVGMLLLSISLAAATHLNATLAYHLELSLARRQASWLAQQTLEQIRWGESWAEASSTFEVAIQIDTLAPELDQIHITVRWVDQRGQPQQLDLHSLINRQPALYAAVLAVRPAINSPFNLSATHP